MVPVTVRRLGLQATVALLFLLGVLDLVQHYQVVPPAAFALSLIRALPLLFFRRLPREVWVIELAAVVVTAVLTAPISSAEPWPWAVTSTGALTVLSGLVASLGDRRLSVGMVGASTGVGLLLAAWPDRGDWGPVVITAVLCAVAAVVGDFVHGRRAMVVQLAEERQVSAEERELRSVVEERARIARELHDVVAHHMSMITVQAETARYRLDDLPPAVVAEFTDIARVARRSLSELRGLLSALRDDGADPNRAPQPTLADVDGLVERIRAAGTPVTLTMAAETGDVPRVLQLAVYRIVQEGLSNVVRHAGAVRTWVDVAVDRTADGTADGTGSAGTLRVEVTNERPDGDRHSDSAGHGLVGLRERVTLLGGTFTVDQPDGGWRIRAELPLGGEAP
jgi:signal transduction histidine kinase